ncbi:hypothetical protein GIB67_042530 [Kingdonia uniflora]|uniref:Nucleoside phosphorylase domain-containing protein n=1 Tax=Kingdonia uniflora TaxID=39325 RepID=A0A7J7M116_9MAGN|nr:hypothetical protein GIB67_042530 [Kingdonia uniflora]
MGSSPSPRVSLSGLNIIIPQSLWVNLEIVLVMFLVLVPSLSMQLRLNHPLHDVVDKVNANGGRGYVGVVMAYAAEEIVLQSSGLFIPNSKHPWVDLSGRRFNIGTIQDTKVICVMSGQRRLNAGITVQILLDIFDIRGIVHYGTAGSANNSLSFGDVSVIKHVAFTGSWNWKKQQEMESEEGELVTLGIGNYNLPMEGENMLAKIEFKPEEFYSVGEPMKEVFLFEVDPKWYNLASQLQDLKLDQCVNETYCLPETPSVVYGLRGSTADIFLDNAAYREFLFKKFEVSTVDEESAAIVLTAMSTGVPCIVFRGVSDLAGGGSEFSSTSLSSLAATNALHVAVEFISLIGKRTMSEIK